MTATRGPVRRGVIADWDGVERVWARTFDEVLGVQASEHPVLLADSPATSDRDRERMAELLLEKFNVPAYFVASTSVLSVYSAGRVSAVVLETGFGVAHAMAVHEGFTFPHTVQRLDVGGADLTDSMATLLAERGLDVTSPLQRDLPRLIKEKCARVATDYAREATDLRLKPDSAPVYKVLFGGGRL